MEEQSKTVACANDEEFQVKEKLYQETKQRANKAEQEIEAQKVLNGGLVCFTILPFVGVYCET